MAEYLNNLKTSSEINDLIENSYEFLYLISPYLNLSQVFKASVRRVDTDKVDFSIVYRSGDSNISTEDSEFFNSLSGINLLKCDNLHAKCYLNESFGIITSLNLYEHSQTHNHEMGVKFSKENDPELYVKALRDARLIIDESLAVTNTDPKKHKSGKNPLPNKNRSIPPKLKEAPKKGLLESVGDLILGDHGYCIRCGNEIDYDNSKPFCRKCFASWSKYKNSEYPEKYCHKCGKKVKTTKSKPICKDCYTKYYKDH